MIKLSFAFIKKNALLKIETIASVSRNWSFALDINLNFLEPAKFK